MRTFSWSSILAATILMAGLCPNSAAQLKGQHQQPALDSKTTWIALGSTYGTPGEFVGVPIQFKPADGVQTSRLKLEVNFPSAYLKFEKVERGAIAEVGSVDLSSQVTTGKNDAGEENSKLTIVESLLSSLPSKEQPKKAIPAGLLATLTFRIADDWGPTTIHLKTSGEATESGSNSPIQKLQTVDGKVDVLVPGGIGCFFFSH